MNESSSNTNASPKEPLTSWEGVDKTVVEKFAAEAGHPAREPYINTDQGDLLLFLFLLAGAIGGFVMGYAYRAIFSAAKIRREGGSEIVMHQHSPHLSAECAHEGDRPRSLDVRARLIVGVAGIVAVLLTSRPWFGFSAFLGCLVAMAYLRTLNRSLFHRFVGPLAFACLLGLMRMFMTGSTPLFSFNLGPWVLTATREGLADGVLIASRVLGTVGVAFLVCEGLSAYELFAALRWAKMPATWVEIALLMYRYLHLFLAQAASVTAAQKVRLGYNGFKRSLRSAGSLAGIVMLRSLDQAEKSHEAMVARGYQGFMPLPVLPPLSRRQLTLGVVGAALITVVYCIAERGLA